MIWFQCFQTAIDCLRFDDDTFFVELMRLLGQTETQRNELIDGDVQQTGRTQIQINLETKKNTI